MTKSATAMSEQSKDDAGPTSPDAANAACAATIRYNSRMRQLEIEFEARASELLEAYMAELADIREGEAT
jgi:hypothetical protein